MRSWLARVLLRLARKLDANVIHVDHIPNDVFWQDVRQLTSWVETQPAMPGEVKAAEVVARLQYRYPSIPRRQLHWAVERVLMDTIR